MAEYADIAHLLRRTEFVVRPDRFNLLKDGTIADAVDDILNFTLNNNSVPGWLTVNSENGWEQYVGTVNWWLESMKSQPRPFQEKMTLFWHGHFVSSWWTINRADHMTHQNQLYRTQALGNFRTLTHAMSLEPAMLVYLNNADNRKGSPNQNFARELMELFTLGVGNYTEADVEAAARAWTGHNADWPNYQYQFFPTRHDNTVKTFFGTTKNWDGPDIINEILRDNAAKKQIAARFMVRKLWDFFAYPGGPAPVIDALTTVFLNSDLDVRTLMRALFNRPEFYSTEAKQGLVRTPMEWLVAIMHATGLTAEQLGASWIGERMGQSLLNPPNVAGWKHNAYWLNTSAISGRAQVARGVTWHLRNNDGFAELGTMPTAAAVDQVATFFNIAPLSTTTRNALIAAHQAERDAQEWVSWWAPTNLLTMAMLTPEMHMA